MNLIGPKCEQPPVRITDHDGNWYADERYDPPNTPALGSSKWLRNCDVPPGGILRNWSPHGRLRRWRGNSHWSRHSWVWNRFRDIKWLRTGLMCAHHAGCLLRATRCDWLSTMVRYFESRICISSKMPFGGRAGMSRHVANHRRRRCLTRVASPYAY